MVRRYIPVEEQQFIMERAKRRCEYCQCPMEYAVQPFVFEHIIPVARGGDTSVDNLAFACGGCNGHKYTKIEALDSATQELTQLYHPRRHQWHEHFAWNDDYLLIIALTPVGRATIETLKMNRTGVINIRRLLRLDGQYPPNE